MKKLFISQPMRDKTGCCLIPTTYVLGKSLELLSTADVAYFCKGWDEYRGCKIEHTCATEYGIDVMYFND